jgi:hypothetical protein
MWVNVIKLILQLIALLCVYAYDVGLARSM